MKQLKTCCFISNYSQDLQFEFEEINQYYKVLKVKFKRLITFLIEDLSVTNFISGMDLGLEQYAAEIVLDFKKIYPKIVLEGVLPFETQALKWTEFQRNGYYSIMKRCDKETLMQYHYTLDCMWKRDRYMINKSKFVIIAYNGDTSRIDKLILYARSIGKVVFIIDLATLDITPNLRIFK